MIPVRLQFNDLTDPPKYFLISGQKLSVNKKAHMTRKSGSLWDAKKRYKTWNYVGTIIRTGITSKKIPLYARLRLQMAYY